MSELAHGQTIAGHYRLEKLLGEGGMGAVWAATDTSNDQRVALKFMKGVALTMPEMHKRFVREARAATAVKHPCVVRIHEIVRDDLGAPVMVMDLLKGESLGERLERQRPLPLATFAQIYLQVVSAVGTAHSVGIVHRDLKPDNIFLVDDGTAEPAVRILDFGIAKLTALEGDAAQTAGLTGTGAMLGTPYYMSPEQVFGDKTIDHRADVWSLGVILFETLSGVKPIQGENLGQLLRVITTGQVPSLDQYAPHLPREILDLSWRMLQLDRAKRPADLREVYETFRRYTGVEAESFAAATVELSSADLASIAPQARLGTTTGAPLSATTPTTPRRSRTGLVAGVLTATAVLGGGTIFALKYAGPTAVQSPAAAAVTGSETESSKVKAKTSAPSIQDSADPPTPSVVASNSIVKPVAPGAKASSKPASSTAPVASALIPSLPASTKSMGGVASEVPF